jgi:uncharacterized membrane-anchored protein
MNPSETTLNSPTRRLLSRVPEVTIWFWIIKILCTTVGESFADWINMALGVGLTVTAIIFIVVTAVVLTAQMRLRRYVPGVYWLTVVVMSITGTLLTDILTDQLGVPLWASSAVFAVLLAIVFGAWYSKERTLSIHSIVSAPREAFYWVTVLVTFALGTALGDWTLELTGWGPGASILLPLTLIAIVTGLWWFGASPVLTFWIAYILTRPLGANIGDWLGLSPAEQGLGLGTFATSVAFLIAILMTVIFLSITKADVDDGRKPRPARAASRRRERRSVAVLGVVAVALVSVLAFANNQPHRSVAAEGAAPTCSSGTPLGKSEAKAAVQAHFPSTDRTNFSSIASDALVLVQKNDKSGASARITDLETAWDDAEPTLNAADCAAWTFVDGQVDSVLTAVRASSPDVAVEKHEIEALLATLAGK